MHVELAAAKSDTETSLYVPWTQIPEDFPYVVRVVSDILESKDRRRWQPFVRNPCVCAMRCEMKRRFQDCHGFDYRLQTISSQSFRYSGDESTLATWTLSYRNENGITAPDGIKVGGLSMNSFAGFGSGQTGAYSSWAKSEVIQTSFRLQTKRTTRWGLLRFPRFYRPIIGQGGKKFETSGRNQNRYLIEERDDICYVEFRAQPWFAWCSFPRIKLIVVFLKKVIIIKGMWNPLILLRFHRILAR